MNKIMIDNNKIYIKDSDIYLLEINESKKLTINVDKNINSKLVIYSNNIDYDLNINIDLNSHLIINSLNNNVNSNNIVNLLENSIIEYNYSIIGSDDSINKFYINHLNKNTKSIINCNGINLSNNKLFIEIDGIIKKDISSCETSQCSKIINYQNGNSKIIPNLIIENKDVIANHSAYIGNLSEEDVFYIKSRGISEQEMYKLLYRSLLLGKMNLDKEEELFNKLLKEWGVL